MHATVHTSGVAAEARPTARGPARDRRDRRRWARNGRSASTGSGRIGKLTLWHHLGRDDFDRFVVNTGRQVGTSLESVVQYLSKDSTYGPLHRFLFGRSGVRDMQRRRRGDAG